MKRIALLISLCILASFIIYIALVCLPYTHQKDVSSDVKKDFNIDDYYSDSAGCDRAMILSDNGDALAERVRLIANAKNSVTLSTFDFKADVSGKILMAAMYDAAKRGVKVQILIDGFSYLTHCKDDPYFEALGSHENVTLKVYNPVNPAKPTKLMARMHDKYVIVDDTAYILGGRNSYDYFLGEHDGYKNYDWDVLVYNTQNSPNSSLYQVREYFENVWELDICKEMYKKPSKASKKNSSKYLDELDSIYSGLKADHGKWFEETAYTLVTSATNNIRLVSNPIEPSVKEPVVFYTMTELMAQSDEKIVFHTPYIMCNKYMLQRLSKICSDNDNVWLMTNSVANNGNPFGATDYLLHKSDIIDTGVNILEYDEGVSYHGKCFTIGDRITAIGSFNWDMRSAYLDTELMLIIDSTELTSAMQKEMNAYEENALIVTGSDSYISSDGTAATPKEISKKRKLRIALIKPIDWLIRFLM